MNRPEQSADYVRCDHEDHVSMSVVEEVGNRLRNAEELLRRHILDWGKCDHPDDCSCSDAEARRFVGWEWL